MRQLVFIIKCFAPPVSQTMKGCNEDFDMGILELEFDRYLKEVVQTLESDPVFRLKLENADESEIKSGTIADDE
ncbi:hypothetical protein JTB14_011285 [Gonioctena quinquepunctata]|nr:hypothetical protein JTB14_011285 [Gonioctena quinquepunctata]